MIEDQFLNREIGMETPDLFLLSVGRILRRKCFIYNKMYEQMMKEIDPLKTVDMTTEAENQSDSNTTNRATSTADTVAENKSRGVASNNPQVRLAANADYASSMSDATGRADSTSETVAEDESESSGSSASTSRMHGYSGSAALLISDYFGMLTNVDEMVIADLNICFMQIWNTNAEYGAPRYV